MPRPAPAGAITPLFSAKTIAGRIDSLASEIAACGLHDPIVVAVLKGSFVFAADLIRALHAHGFEPEIDFISLASYGTGTTGRAVRVLRDVEGDLQSRDVVVVDDILDSGRTLVFAKERLAARGARSVRTCVLLDKKGRRANDVVADFIGFDCPNRFVVGYGMDRAHRYRELPFIGVVDRGG